MPVTGAAFSIARYKIKLNFFIDLNTILSDHIQSLPAKLWKGYRLIAGDGSTISLPASPQIKSHFGIYSISKGKTSTCLARAFLFYDVLSDFVLDSIIAPVSIGEIPLLKGMLKNLQSTGSIILLDRGFGYFSTCKNISNTKIDFCVRISIGTSNFSRAVLANPSGDFITEWIPGNEEKRTCKVHGLDYEPIQVRVSKILLKNGQIELLISTLLDMQSINIDDMQALYDLRWGIEEGFKKMKPKMKLEQFGCKRYEGIYQEFYAHIFMMNLVSIIANDSEELIIEKIKEREHLYKYNWQNAFRFVRNKFIEIFHLGEFKETLEKIKTQIASSLICVKKGRHFIRDVDGKRRRAGYSQCYK